MSVFVHILLSLVALGAFAVAVRLAWLYRAQRGIIYNPGVIAREQFNHLVQELFGGLAKLLPRFDALVLEPTAGLATGTAIWFHGNGGVALDRAHFAPIFAKRGLRLILAEYPGHAARPGAPSERSLVEDAAALYDEVLRTFPGDLWLVGESLGTGVAAQVAVRALIKPKRLVLLTPFLSLAEAAAQRYPLLPVRYLIKDLFDSAKHLAKYSGPISILIAGADEVIHPRQGRALAKICGKSAFVLEVPDATHSGWADLIDEESWSFLLGMPVRVPA